MNVINTYLPVNSSTRPQWLQRASVTDQVRYGELEQQLIISQAELEKQLGNHLSLRTYTRYLIGQALQLEFGRTLDPDTLMTTSRYVFEVAGRRAIQEDKRSLTDLLLCGLHENGRRAAITFHGEGLPVGLTQEWLEENWTQDLRAAYGTKFRAVYQRSGVLAAMNAETRDRLLLSVFAASLQDHINEANLQRVQRAVAGDANLTIAPLRLLPHTRALKDLVVIGSREGDVDDWLLYAPGSPGKQDWYTYSAFRRLSLSISGWLAPDEFEPGKSRHPEANDVGCQYLTWQSHALDREMVGGYLKRVPLKPANWSGVTLAPSSYSGNEVLNAVVYNDRDWRISQEESHTPYGYRNAPEELRQQFTRINCEFKALKTIEVRQAGLISYEQFCFDLIKQRVEEVLLQRGQRVVVNPDLIYVQISAQQQMTLTQLIVNEIHFYASGVGEPLYPRFSLSGAHPEVNGLDIRDIASWSRTLRPGEKYIDMLRSVDLNPTHPEGKFKRGIYLGGLQRQMKVAIMQARFNGRLPQEHFMELLKVVDMYVENDPLRINKGADAFGNVAHSALHKLSIETRPVIGVYVFKVVVAGGTEEYLFTPGTPDGRELRPFNEFVSGVKTLGLGDYFYERVYEKYQPQVGTYLTDLEELSNFTKAPTQGRDSRVKDFNECYTGLFDKVISDVDEKTESLNEIIGRLIWEGVTLAASAIAIVYAPIGIAMTAVLLTKNLVQGFEAYSEGNRAKALSHFTDALIELASLGKAGAGKSAVKPVQRTFISLLGDARKVEKLVCGVIGQPTLDKRVLQLIQEILDDPESVSSKTTLV